MTMVRLVCASANPHKVEEIRAIVGSVIELVPRPEDVPDVVEDADTLEGNARLKAAAIAAATGLPAVADDTGLDVAALHGAPGVHTARYAGEECSEADNRVKLLAELAAAGAVAPEQRHAQFRTVALVAWPDGHEAVAHGVTDGVIADRERGERGFGYDPVFIPVEGDGRTFAEMSEDEKHAVSHRGRAFRELLDLLVSDPSVPPDAP